MTLDELKAELGAILALEEQSPTDWQQVAAHCLRTIERLGTEGAPTFPHEVVYHYLDDPDVREKDANYGDRQRECLRHWLSAPD